MRRIPDNNTCGPKFRKNLQISILITARYSRCGKVMFFTGMCHSFCPHGGCIPACNGAGGVQSSMQWVGVKVSACRGVSQGGGLLRGMATTPPRRPLKWVVCILLECILVLKWIRTIMWICQIFWIKSPRVQENISHSAIDGTCLLDLGLGTGSLHGSWMQLFNWPMWLYRQWLVFELWHTATGTSTSVALGDWTETNKSLKSLYLQSIFNIYKFHRIIVDSWIRDSA